jgi:hypothetical protein
MSQIQGMTRCPGVLIAVFALCGACSKNALRAHASSGAAGSAGSVTGVAGAGQAAAGGAGQGLAAEGGGGSALGAAGATAGASAAGASAGQSGRAGSAGSGLAGAAGVEIAGASASSGRGGSSGSAGSAGRAGSGAGGSAGSSAAGSGGAMSSLMPVYRIPLRIHTALSKLTDADLGPVLAELNQIWLQQAGICFEIEVTTDETNRSDGFDFRYTAGKIPNAPSANGLTENAHSIWSIDHPNLGSAPHPVQNPTARTTAHELGHALGLAHENPPPSTDCASPCYCVTLGDNCDDFLLRSGTKGYFLSAPEVDITRKNAAKRTLMDSAAASCAAPVFMQ